MKHYLRLAIVLLVIAMILSIPVFGQDARYRIAVMPFDDGSIQNHWWGNNWEVGKGVSDELVTELLKTNKFRLIEREQLDKILKEQDMGADGRIDPRSAARIGKILGVQFLVMGKVTEFSNDSQEFGAASGKKGIGLAVKSNVARVAIDARLVDTTSAEIITSVTGKGEKKETSLGLMVKWNTIAFGSNEFKKTNLGIALRDAVTSVANQLADQAYAYNVPPPPMPAPPPAPAPKPMPVPPPQPTYDSRPRVAVLPFDDGSIQNRWWGNNWDVGKGVSDEMVTELLKTNKFRLIEREQIEKILKEQNFGAQGRVDPYSAARIGKILGVQYLIMGKVTEFTTDSQSFGAATNKGGIGIKSNVARVAIDARLVDTTTAEIVAAVTGRGEKKQTNLGIVAKSTGIAFGSNEFKQTNLGQALRDAVTSVAQQIGDNAPQSITMPIGNPGGPPYYSSLSGKVAEVYGSKIYINIGSQDGVQKGMVFIVKHIVKIVKDPSTGDVLDYITEPVAEISVSEVKDKSATCIVKRKLSTKYAIASKDFIEQKM